MLKHYLIITIRNILANKFNYLLTTLGLAVGISIFAVIYFMVDVFDLVNGSLPNEANLYQIETVGKKEGKDASYNYNVPFSVLKKLQEQQIPEIEFLAIYTFETQFYCNEESNEKAIFETSVRDVNSSFFHCVGAKFTEGNTNIWDSNENSAVITEGFSKKMFGNINPIGRKIEIRNTHDYLYGVFTVSGIIKPIYSRNCEANIYLKMNGFTDKYVVDNFVKLKDGTSQESFNQQLKALSSQLDILNQEKVENGANYYLRLTNFLNNGFKIPLNIRFLVLLLASIVLIISLFNFFNLLIGSVHIRIRQFSLRKVVGANSWAFFSMILCEIIPILAGALLGSYIFIELLIKWYESSQFMLPELTEEYGLMRLIYLYPLKIAGWTLLACALIALLLAQRIQKIVLVQGIRGKLLKSNRNYFRNTLIIIQLTFTLMFLSITFGIIQFVSTEIGDVYRTLSKKQTQSVFQIPTNILKISTNRDEIISRIKQIPGVENAVVSKGYGSSIEYDFANFSNGKSYPLFKTTYFEGYNHFFELKDTLSISSLAPDEVIVNEKLAAFLRENGETELNTAYGKYKIVGTIKYIPYTEINKYCALIPPGSGYRPEMCLVKCHPQQSEFVKKDILKIIREYIPETIPYRISTLSEEMNAQYYAFYGIVGVMWLASVMSLILTLLGIYTAVTTDTRRRKREIAIRKINGATYRDIILQFIKQYAIMLIIALVVSIPLISIALTILQVPLNSIKDGLINTITPWCAIVVFVYLTIFRLIRQAARKNPAEVIKSE